MFNELVDQEEMMEPRPYNTMLLVYPVSGSYYWFDIHGTAGRGYQGDKVGRLRLKLESHFGMVMRSTHL